MRIAGSSGDVGTHWCGSASPMRCMARGLRVPLDCCCERVGLCPGRRPSGRCRRPEWPVSSGWELVGMEVMFERVAGLDVGKAAVTVCVRTPSTRAGRRRSETRTFATMSRSLGVMRDWLVAEGVSIAAIESTSTYWKPPFYCLEEVMHVWLL